MVATPSAATAVLDLVAFSVKWTIEVKLIEHRPPEPAALVIDGSSSSQDSRDENDVRIERLTGTSLAVGECSGASSSRAPVHRWTLGESNPDRAAETGEGDEAPRHPRGPRGPMFVLADHATTDRKTASTNEAEKISLASRPDPVLT